MIFHRWSCSDDVNKLQENASSNYVLEGIIEETNSERLTITELVGLDVVVNLDVSSGKIWTFYYVPINWYFILWFDFQFSGCNILWMNDQ